MQPSPLCSAPLAGGGCKCLGLLFCWELWLGMYSVGLFFFSFFLFPLPAMLPSEIPKLPTGPQVRGFPGVWILLLLHNSLPRMSLTLVYLFVFYILSYLLSKRMGCLSGCLVSSASVQKLFCGICSAFRWSFDEFVGEKVVSPSYSSAMLGLPPLSSFLMNLFSYAVCWLLRSLIYCEMKCLSLRHVRPFVTPWDSPGNTRVDCHFLLQICFQGICKYKLIFINICV